MNHVVEEYRESELTMAIALPIAVLAGRSFRNSTGEPEQRAREIVGACQKEDLATATGRRFVIWDSGKAIAHAKTFARIVSVEGRSFPVLALATVCSDPDLRGHGLGKIITLKAFEQVGREDSPSVSLFQTPVPGFYEKLNCRLVTNRFVNPANKAAPEANPWRDDYVMIYPAEFDWPEGVVDLGGPDY